MTEAEAKVIYEIAKEKEEAAREQQSLAREALLLEARVVAVLVEHNAIDELKRKIANYDASEALCAARRDETSKAIMQWTSFFLSKPEAANG